MNSCAMFLALALILAPTGTAFAQTTPTATAPPSQAIHDADLISVKSVVGQIQIALANIQIRLSAGQLPPLKSVTLTFQTVASKSGEAKIKLWIISLGKTWEPEKSQEINLVLTPPPARKGRQTNSLARQLEDVIVSTAESIKGGSGGPTPLHFSGLSVELGFVISGDSSAGGQFEIVPVSAELSGDISKKAVHKMLVVFEESSPRGEEPAAR